MKRTLLSFLFYLFFTNTFAQAPVKIYREFDFKTVAPISLDRKTLGMKYFVFNRSLPYAPYLRTGCAADNKPAPFMNHNYYDGQYKKHIQYQ